MDKSATRFRKCPRCKKGRLDTRVSRSSLVKLALGWLPIKRYKCDTCGRKVHLLLS